MFKLFVVIFAVIASVAAKPGLLASAPLAFAAPAPFAFAAPAPFVTATSSQVIARNYNGIAHAPVLAAAPVLQPVHRVAAPLAVASAAYSAPVLAAGAPFSYSAPLSYAHTAPAQVLW